MHCLFLLSQVDPSKLSSDLPRIEVSSSTTTWLLAGVLAIGILLLTFKQARRNYRD